MEGKTREQDRANARKQLFEKLKQENPGVQLYPITSRQDGIEIVVRGADPGLWLKYRAMSGDFSDPAKRAQADEMLVLGSMVHPDSEKFREELEQRNLTGFYRSAAPFVAKISGAREDLVLGEEL